MPDKLIGTLSVVETRLAKYVAVSRLTQDLLDTSAVSASVKNISPFTLARRKMTARLMVKSSYPLPFGDVVDGLQEEHKFDTSRKAWIPRGFLKCPFSSDRLVTHDS